MMSEHNDEEQQEKSIDGSNFLKMKINVRLLV